MSTSTESEVAAAQEKAPIQLEVTVESPQACLREVVVTIPEAEVQRYLKDAYDELVPEAQVPGFRSGRAPRKLVEKQFKDRVTEQVKGSLLMDSLSQVTDSEDFSAIGEPDFDYNSIEIPDSGDFKYQFQIEVRPEFDTPTWKGLDITKPVEEIGEGEVQQAIDRVLSKYATLEATDAPAKLGDTLLVSAKFTLDDKVISEMEEEKVTLQERLSFTDAVAADFGSAMTGVTEGDSKSVSVTLADGIEDESLRGKEVEATFSVVEVLKREMPELTESFLEELGDFDSEDELKSFVKDSLVRQADYRTQQELRKTVIQSLAGDANFELPESLVKRQTMRELERKVLELRRSGFDEDAVRRFVNASKQNAQASTESALREHFILEKIAEEENVEADDTDYDAEVALIAQQSDQPERRVRARLEKQGQMDALRNQIIERKVIDLIVEAANVTEEKVDSSSDADDNEFAVYHSVIAAKEEANIPEAKYDDNTPAGAEKDADKA